MYLDRETWFRCHIDMRIIDIQVNLNMWHSWQVEPEERDKTEYDGCSQMEQDEEEPVNIKKNSIKQEHHRQRQQQQQQQQHHHQQQQQQQQQHAPQESRFFYM